MSDSIKKIDLHMHTIVSDGTDSPVEILGKVQDAGIDMFAITDHDAIKGCGMLQEHLHEGCPKFITGAEFSCKDENGKYHILGYAYDPNGESIKKLVEKGHGLRMKKLDLRLEFLKSEFGFSFPEEEIQRLHEMDNPGKPHIGNLMVKCGFAASKEEAIKEFINKRRFGSEYVRPEEAIEGILKSGGIPVLAHPSYGSGDDIIVGDEMDKRVECLCGYGLKGVEAFYSGFTEKLTREILSLADKYNLYITAGSDYHGTNKTVVLGDTGLSDVGEAPEGCRRFIVEALNRSGY